MVLLTALADRCIGLEQEFFLVDKDGILSNRADKFLDLCREAARESGRDPEASHRSAPVAW